MDAFTLLKYWRSSGGGSGGDGGGGANMRTLTSSPTTLVTAAVDDDGPFFDLELAGVSDDGDEEENEPDGESEFRFTLSSGSSLDRTDLNSAVSPSDDLFFKGSFFPAETETTSSGNVSNGSDPNPKSQFSLLKSVMLKLKKPRPDTDGSASPSPAPEETQQQKTQKKLFTVKLKLKVEDVPIVSLFVRDNSSKSHSGETHRSSDEKKLTKDDVMQRYLKMVKPLYVRGSKRYGQKSKFSAKSAEQKSSVKTTPLEPQISSNVKGNLTAGFRGVCKHLGKSRSVVAAETAATGSTQTSRRDDSLLLQQDGIQSAILHCKRSFNEPRG